MTPVTEHLIIAPIVIPFLAGALMLLYDERQRRAKLVISIGSAIALLLVAVELLQLAKGSDLPGQAEIGFYLLGDWAAPFGIVLVVDRLSAMMLVLVALLAIPSLIYSAAGWHRQGQHYHSLFQFLLMGLNGAFLTGDLFNLFVFFEVMLAASYGLLLHSSSQLKVRAGLHYIAINLAASLFFLIGVSLVYGVTGTLNMAHLAQIVPEIPDSERPLFHAGAAIMGMAFLVKAGFWPLSFWLPTAYMAAAAPVAAMFAIMTKVGVYVIMRLSMLLFGPDAGPSAGFGSEVLIIGGMCTVVFGLLGVLAAQSIGRMTAHLVLVSSGTLLAVTGFALAGGGPAMLAGGLYYLLSSTLATAGLFLLIEPMSREEGGIASMLALTADAYGLDQQDEDEQPEVGLAVPATLTVLGLSFGACLIALAGMPPLSGFIGKVAILSGVMSGTTPTPGLTPETALELAPNLSPAMGWTFLAITIVAGLATLIGLIRIGIQTFWASDNHVPRVLALEVAPILALVALILILTVKAQDTLRYLQATSSALHDPAIYATGVFEAPRVVDTPAEEEEAS